MNLTIRQSHLLIEVETMNPDVACFQVCTYVLVRHKICIYSVCVCESDKAHPYF